MSDLPHVNRPDLDHLLHPADATRLDPDATARWIPTSHRNCNHPACIQLIVNVPFGEHVDVVGAHVHLEEDDVLEAGLGMATGRVVREVEKRERLLEAGATVKRGGVVDPPPLSVETDQPPADFWMVIEDSFLIKGRGTAVTGRVAAGEVKPGDLLRIVQPSGDVAVTCFGVETHAVVQPLQKPGSPVGVLIGDVLQPSQITNGTILCARPPSFDPKAVTVTIPRADIPIIRKATEDCMLRDLEHERLDAFLEQLAERANGGQPDT